MTEYEARVWVDSLIATGEVRVYAKYGGKEYFETTGLLKTMRMSGCRKILTTDEITAQELAMAEIAIKEVAKLIAKEMDSHRVRLHELKKLRIDVYSGDRESIKKVLEMSRQTNDFNGG